MFWNIRQVLLWNKNINNTGKFNKTPIDATKFACLIISVLLRQSCNIIAEILSHCIYLTLNVEKLFYPILAYVIKYASFWKILGTKDLNLNIIETHTLWMCHLGQPFQKLLRKWESNIISHFIVTSYYNNRILELYVLKLLFSLNKFYFTLWIRNLIEIRLLVSDRTC